LLILTTTRRLALLLFVFLAWTPAAYAWSWPVQGPVLKPFAYDEAHPYAAGQHRGIDIGADSAGEPVVAPAAGTVSFAGSVPTNGKTVTIETADGYSVTLTHLGSIAVVQGAAIAERDAVGTIGPSGTPEVDGPYVHLGIRLTADPNGYVDPLGLLPPPTETGADASGSTASQPASSGTTSAPPASKPRHSAPRRALPTATSARSGRSQVRAHDHQPAKEPRSDVRATRSLHRPVFRAKQDAHPRASRDRVSEQTRSSRRPFVEPAATERGPSAYVASPRREPSSPLPALVCNWAAALFALGGVLLARRRRSNTVSAKVLHLPLPEDEVRRVSRAA
jgi:MYXO-CTERM domain-containing protein